VNSNGSFVALDKLDVIKKAVAEKSGGSINLASIIQLNTDFIDVGDDYMLLNIKGFETAEPNNILFLTSSEPLLFSKDPPSMQEISIYDKVLLKPFGINTVIVFVMLNKILKNYEGQLEQLTQRLGKLEAKFEHEGFRDVAHEFDRIADRLEEFNQLLLQLQERRCTQIDTQYISFDYRIMVAESSTLQAMCRRRQNSIKDLRQDHENQTTDEMNKKIVRLNEVVKRLTAITVILMLPTIIESHFGMNFVNMPELKLAWGYGASIGLEVSLMLVAFLLFRKYKWL
jgi:hypothetical protein